MSYRQEILKPFYDTLIALGFTEEKFGIAVATPFDPVNKQLVKRVRSRYPRCGNKCAVLMKTAARKTTQNYEVNVLTTDEARELFDKSVRETLGIESSEFIKKYQQGAYEDGDDCDIMSLLMLLPFTGYSAKYATKQSR
jgi:hypothetical protein